MVEGVQNSRAVFAFKKTCLNPRIGKMSLPVFSLREKLKFLQR